MTAIVLWRPFSSLWSNIAARLHRKAKPARKASVSTLPSSPLPVSLFTSPNGRTGHENQIHRLC